jgi:hypothetical protein
MRTNQQTIEEILTSAPWLSRWQKRAILLACGIAGTVVAMIVLRILEQRRAARLAVAKQPETDK